MLINCRNIRKWDKSNIEIRQIESWFKTYKSLQLIMERVNDLYGSALVPVSVNFVISVCVLSLYIVIGTNCTVQFKVVCVACTLMGLCNVHFLLMRCVKATDQSARAIRMRQEQLNLRNIYFRRRFKTCFLLKMKVGPFRYLDRPTMVVALKSIVDYTMSLLLTLK